MNKNELAMRFYDAARAEMLERIRLRENIILFYVGAVATLLGVVFGKDGVNTEVLFVIPLLSLAASILVCHHNSLIGSLVMYCSLELKESLHYSVNDNVTLWEQSNSLLQGSSKAVTSRLLPHLLIISMPAIIALIVNLDYLSFSFSWDTGVWLLGLMCFIGSVYSICQSGLERKNQFKEIETQQGA